jgi:hypothetical protein
MLKDTSWMLKDSTCGLEQAPLFKTYSSTPGGGKVSSEGTCIRVEG